MDHEQSQPQTPSQRSDHQATAEGSTSSPARSGGVIGLFIDRPVLSLMVAMTLIALGVLSFSRLPLRLTPSDLVEGQLNLYVPVAQSMTPGELQDQVLKPLEEQIRTIPGIAELRSRCDDDSAFIAIEFDPDTNVMLAAAEVRDRAQRAKLEWPRGVDRYFTWREDGSSAPLAFLQILTPEVSQVWADKLENIIKPRLERVDGVGQIDIWGLTSESLRIWFDRDKLVAHRVDYGELLQRLSSDNFAEPIGEVDDGQRRYLARVDSRFRSQTEIENYPVRPELKLKDVARVERVPSVRDRLARFDGSYTYTAVLRLAAGSNPVEAGHDVRAVMDELREEPKLDGLAFRFLFDQGSLIEDSLNTLLQTSVQGGLLALIALFAFLRNLRATIAIALSIPLALLIAGIYLFFAGRSLNLLTMAGMTLAVGLVVDNSVVVLENIRRRREEGLPIREAAIEGTREIILAITMATLTTVVVILPLVFMSGEGSIRALLSALGLTLSVGLVGSLLVACFLLPSGVRHLSPNIGARSAANARAHTRKRRRSKWSPIAWLAGANRRLVHWTLRYRWAVVIASLLVIMTIKLPWNGLDFEEKGGGPFQGGEVSIYLEIPNGRTLRDVAGLIREYEDFLATKTDEWNIEHVSNRFGRTSARFDILLTDAVEREEFDDYGRKIRAGWPRKPGVSLRLKEQNQGQRGGAAKDDKNSKNFVVRLWGRDTDYLTDRALVVAQRLLARDEVVSVEIDRVEGNKEVVVNVDRQRLSDFKVSPTQLQRVMASGLQGQELTRFQEGDRDVRLIAQFDAERNPTLQDLRETQIWSQTGTFQRVDDMTDIEFESSLERINRIDGRTTLQITGTRAEDVSSKDFSGVLADVMSGVSMPRGYTWSEASYSGEIEAQALEIVKAAALSITLVFMLMGVLFESVVLSAATLVTVPFALCGAMWSLFFFFGALDVMSFIGMLLLCGIVVNNGIVLLDCIERLRREGRSRTYAILRGTRIRLRPIVMTAVTTIVGLLPMAIFGESTGEGVSYVSMSIAVAGGLALSTLCTAFAVPLAYTYLDDFTRFWRTVFRRAAGRGGDRKAATAASPKAAALSS